MQEQNQVELQKDLLNAALDGDFNEVNRLIATGAQPDADYIGNNGQQQKIWDLLRAEREFRLLDNNITQILKIKRHNIALNLQQGNLATENKDFVKWQQQQGTNTIQALLQKSACFSEGSTKPTSQRIAKHLPNYKDWVSLSLVAKAEPRIRNKSPYMQWQQYDEERKKNTQKENHL